LICLRTDPLDRIELGRPVEVAGLEQRILPLAEGPQLGPALEAGHRGAQQEQGGHPGRPPGGDLQSDPAAAGRPHDREVADRQCGERGQHVVGVVVEAGRQRRVAEPAQVAADRPEAGLDQRRDLRIPHTPIDHGGVQQQHGRAIAGHIMSKSHRRRG
jgi:hypothetical protein